jgi:dUTP pyrophosphatase
MGMVMKKNEETALIETVGVKLVHKLAKLPMYAHEDDAGCDLYAVENVHINPSEVQVVKTGLVLSFSAPVEAQIRTRSGMATKGIIVANSPGTIDPGYRGEVGVILVNVGRNPYDVQIGDRVAQLVFSQYTPVKFSVVQELDKTERGDGGFGSSGR